MALEVSDVAGLSAPLTKLTEVVSAGIGTLYRPKAIRDEADAKAYEYRALERAKAEAEQERQTIELNGTLQRVEAVFGARPELVERAKQRLLTREVEGQLNIEAIADHAAESLSGSVSEDPVSPDWRRKFFMEAENICAADLQLLWGKVLAGEVSSPGTFSLRTLDTLRQLSQAEAELFRRACAIAMNDGWIAAAGQDMNTALVPYGLNYGSILSLRDAGLVTASDNLHKRFEHRSTPERPLPVPIVLFNNGTIIEIAGPGLAMLNIRALQFTRAGIELQRLIDHQPIPDYYKALGVHIRQLGCTAKRGTFLPQSDGVSVVEFAQDL